MDGWGGGNFDTPSASPGPSYQAYGQPSAPEHPLVTLAKAIPALVMAHLASMNAPHGTGAQATPAGNVVNSTPVEDNTQEVPSDWLGGYRQQAAPSVVGKPDWMGSSLLAPAENFLQHLNAAAGHPQGVAQFAEPGVGVPTHFLQAPPVMHWPHYYQPPAPRHVVQHGQRVAVPLPHSHLSKVQVEGRRAMLNYLQGLDENGNPLPRSGMEGGSEFYHAGGPSW